MIAGRLKQVRPRHGDRIQARDGFPHDRPGRVLRGCGGLGSGKRRSPEHSGAGLSVPWTGQSPIRIPAPGLPGPGLPHVARRKADAPQPRQRGSAGGASSEARRDRVRRPSREASPADGGTSGPNRLHWLVVFYLVSLVVPFIFPVGPLRLAPYRLVLAVAIGPCLLMWLNGRAGRIRSPDIAVVLYCIWGAVCLAVADGVTAALEPSGMLVIETAGAYLLARCMIRSADDFRHMASLLFKIVLFLIPFGLVELLTGYKPLLQGLGKLMQTINVTMMDVRWGMRRVQGPFEHPLLFGVFVGSVLAPVHLVLGHGQAWPRRWLKTATVGGATFLSLSSGPLTAIFTQLLILLWNWSTRAIALRWQIFWAIVVTVYLVITLFSNQSVGTFFVSYAPVFDSWSAYYRILIWEYGTQTVMNHPIFGIGYHEYTRPAWMAPSVDMFWLIHAIMFGIPGVTLVSYAVVSCAVTVALAKPIDPRVIACQTSYLIVLGGFFIVGWGVDFWNGVYTYFFFFLGAGMWVADAARSELADRSLGSGDRAGRSRGEGEGDRSGRSRSAARQRCAATPGGEANATVSVKPLDLSPPPVEAGRGPRRRGGYGVSRRRRDGKDRR